ncbi:MAG: Asp/Glu racemase [Rhodobacterales bacterium]|nr:MAG: Asp/Glu racemase [Rhodobacterales bacterium]
MTEPYELDHGYGGGARLGLIVLSTDETLEGEAREVVTGRPVNLLHARIPSQPDVTPASLETMAGHMTQTAALLPEGLDVVGYGCTSGATIIGPERVEDLVKQGCGAARVTNPLTAVIEALHAVNARRIAFVSPYVAEVNAPMRARLAEAGFETVAEASFAQSDDWIVARITEFSTRTTVERVVKSMDCDAVFTSCTNLRSFGIIEQIEASLGVPVISSNLALLWHMLVLSGVDATGWGPGRLFQL